MHQQRVGACRVHTLPNGHQQEEIATFGTTTPERLRLRDGWREWGGTHAARESTGAYWKPVYSLLEGPFTWLRVHARHLQAVPGRKTEVLDAHWIADRLRHGLLKARFVPPRAQRDRRDLTRQRTPLVEARARVVNRIQKGWERANLQRASVASEVPGVSAQAMLKALVAGQADPAGLAALARGRRREQRAAREAAWTGGVREPHRFMRAQHLEPLEFLEERIAQFDRRIAAQIDPMSAPAAPPGEPPKGSGGEPPSFPPTLGSSRPEAPPPPSSRQAIRLLDPIPGVEVVGAEKVRAELGTAMRPSPSAAPAASWTGWAPGNPERAGRQKGGQLPPGNPAWRNALVQAAPGAIRTQDSCLGALYRRGKARRGEKRAIVAVAHALLVGSYHGLLRQEPYQEWGADYLASKHPDRTADRWVGRLETLGYQGTITARPTAAAASVGSVPL